MAIRKLYNGKYQASVLVSSGRRITRVFRTKREAENQERKWKEERQNENFGANQNKITLDSYFQEWFSYVNSQASETEMTGWRKGQLQLYRDYISPVIGKTILRAVSSQMVMKVLNEMAQKGKSSQTRKHVFNLMRKMFNDAIETYRYVNFNPVLKKLKPKVPLKEASHIGHVDQVRSLLRYVEDKPFSLAIWTQLYLGLRIGELQALEWRDVDLKAGTVLVRRTFVRKTNTVRDYPKGGKQHCVSLPPELWNKLIHAKMTSHSNFVTPSCFSGGMLRYKSYLRALKKYCQELEVPMIGTHGLRHTTWLLYREAGATKDDMQQLFAHSSSKVTERYLHGVEHNLAKVTKDVQLFEKKCAQLFAS